MHSTYGIRGEAFRSSRGGWTPARNTHGDAVRRSPPFGGPTVTATTPAAAQPSTNPGDELNKDLPHWMKFTFESRGREEGRTGMGFEDGANDTYTLTRIRIGLPT